MLAKLLETFTKKNNYQYDTAENGLLALQAFQNSRHQYDIVFMGKQIMFAIVAVY
jgi:DNA-binding response OmpR family regulator